MKKIYILSITLSLLLAIGSCDNFLDVAPTSDVAIPSSADDYRDMLYPMTANFSTDAIIGIMGDDVYWSVNFYKTQPTAIFVNRAYLWEEEPFDITIVPTVWRVMYNHIFIYNKVVNEVGSLKGEPEGTLRNIEAEARLYRALRYFHLVNIFAKPYTQASATDPGIPVILNNDVNDNNKQRTPVREVYAYILEDIDKAIDYLPDYPDLTSRFLATKAGAYGLKARVYFNMGQYGDALTEINNLFTLLETKSSPLGLTYKLLDYNKLALRNEQQPWLGMNPAKNFPIYWIQELPNVESVFTSMLFQRDPTTGAVSGTSPRNAIFASPHVLRLFKEETGDLRYKFTLQNKDQNNKDWDSSEPGLRLKRFYYSNCGVSMPDIYLMAAECYARAKDNTNALKYFNELRKNRIEKTIFQPLNSADNTEILGWILQERMKEFIATGYRWFDMRRLWDDPVGGPMINKTRMLDGQTYTLTKERLTVRIPEYIMQYHPDWQQNP